MHRMYLLLSKTQSFGLLKKKKTQKIDRLTRSLLIQGLPNDIYSLIESNETAKDLWDALERQMRVSKYGEQDRKAAILYEYETFKANEGEQLLDTYLRYLQKQYGTLMRQTMNLMSINIDALYNILKQNQGNVNDALRYKKKAVVVTSDPLALVAEKTKITALLEKAFNRRKFYSKPTNNNLRTSSTSQSANKKQEFVKTDDKKDKKKDDKKKSDMNKVKCYNCKKEEHFAKDCKKAKDQAWMDSSSDSDKEINANMVFMAQIEKVLSDSNKSSLSAEETIAEKHIEKANQQSNDLENQNKDLQEKYDVLINQANTFEEKNNEFNEQIKVLNEKNADLLAQTEVLQDQLKEERYEYMIRYSALCDNDKKHREKIDKQEILFDKMSRQLVEMNNNVLRLQEKIIDKETKILELEGYVSNKDVEIEKCLERLNECENKLHKIKKTNQTIHMIMPSKDTLYNGRKRIGFENPSYFEKAKDLRPSLYDEKVIGLVYTPMFLIHSNEALEIEKFKRARENKIEFAYEYGNLNASYVNEKINFSNDYFKEIINPNFEKIDSPFQQTSSLKPYVSNVILEKIIIDLEDEVVSLLEKEKANLKTIESLKSKGFESSENSISKSKNQSENDYHVVEKECEKWRIQWLCDLFDENNLFIFNDESVRISPVSKMLFRKKPRDSMNVRSKSNSNKSLPRTVHRWLSKMQPLAEPVAKWIPRIVQICLWIIDSGCSKHMTGNRALLTNFVEKFLGTVRFGNNDFAVIAGYGDVDVGKLKAKGNIGVFVGYSKESAAFSIYNKQTLSEASKKDLEDLFQNFYDEHFDSLNIMKSSTTNVETSINEEVFHEVSESFQKESSSSSLNDNVQQSLEEVILPQTNTQSISNNMIPNVDEASTSHNVFNKCLEDAYFDASTSFHDSSNVHTFYQPYPHEKKWTKDHPLHKIIGNPKSSVHTKG
nr:integrase, catalytic region, zinc finger, CCHC-type, peptidase aspartic, catalytic [Tanacetum cinerariifolium]